MLNSSVNLPLPYLCEPYLYTAVEEFVVASLLPDEPLVEAGRVKHILRLQTEVLPKGNCQRFESLITVNVTLLLQSRRLPNYLLSD